MSKLQTARGRLRKRLVNEATRRARRFTAAEREDFRRQYMITSMSGRVLDQRDLINALDRQWGFLYRHPDVRNPDRAYIGDFRARAADLLSNDAWIRRRATLIPARIVDELHDEITLQREMEPEEG